MITLTYVIPHHLAIFDVVANVKTFIGPPLIVRFNDWPPWNYSSRWSDHQHMLIFALTNVDWVFQKQERKRANVVKKGPDEWHYRGPVVVQFLDIDLLCWSIILIYCVVQFLDIDLSQDTYRVFCTVSIEVSPEHLGPGLLLNIRVRSLSPCLG